MIKIVPAILVYTLEEFQKQIHEAESIAEYVQIDVSDGFFVPPIFSDAKRIKKVLTALKYELHLMVRDPVAELQNWKDASNVFRVIFHIESAGDPMECIAAIKNFGWEAGIALNPDTPLALAEPYYNLTDVILFMGVNPGKQSQSFIESVGDKIKLFTHLTPRPLCAVDGGINKNNIKQVADWGAELFNVGSAIFKSEKNVKEAYEELLNYV